jgi:hypothetical protein
MNEVKSEIGRSVPARRGQEKKVARMNEVKCGIDRSDDRSFLGFRSAQSGLLANAKFASPPTLTGEAGEPSCEEAPEPLACVMPGLVPGIYVFIISPQVRRGWPDKPGHDEIGKTRNKN